MRARIGTALKRLIDWLCFKPHRPLANYLGAVGFNLLIVISTLSLMLGWALIGSLLPLPEALFIPFWLIGILSAAAIVGIVLKA